MKYHTNICERLAAHINAENARSAWSKGVKIYALELLEELDTAINDGYFKAEDVNDRQKLHAQLLNGAGSWHNYSWGGASLIYDCDIAHRLCTPSELRKTCDGERRPNSREDWLDVQARALYQASGRIYLAARAEEMEV